MSPPVPEPARSPADPHLRGVFAPVTTELDVADLAIDYEGGSRLPAALAGTYLRNGPNPRFAPLGPYLFPLDGDGMLHAVRIAGGRASYHNRFVRTPALRAEEAAGRALWPGLAHFTETPDASVVGPALAHTPKDLPDVNVVGHAGKLLALAESAPPFRMSAALETLARETFDDALPAGITAHPKLDPRTGELFAFTYALEPPYLTWSSIAADGTVVRAATPVAGLQRPTMIHDMALTQRYLVLLACPFFFDLEGAQHGRPLLSFEATQPTRIALIPRDGRPPRWLKTDAFWTWHLANAHDTVAPNQQPEVVIDYVRWDTPGALAGVHTAEARGALARLRVQPETGKVTAQILVERAMELPRIDDRAIGRAHRIIATAVKTGRRPLIAGDADALGFYDTRHDTFTTWEAGELAVGEPCFIPRPGDPDPTHGWWTTFATHRRTLHSQLLLLAAEDPSAGPIAHIDLPQRVPLGLHGVWLHGLLSAP
jgi:carotenoid cleavage dioxygenase